MPDLKNLTVRYLRELARKHLGKGHSRLKTKEELLAALKSVPEILKGLLNSEESPRPASTNAAAAPRDEDEEVTAPSARPAPPGKKAVPAEVVRFSSTIIAARTLRDSGTTLEEEPRLAEPVEEGFFVAKVAGEEEARRHHLTHTPAYTPPPGPPVYDEKLGDLPWSYTEDDVVVLARDPRTLFVFWNLTPDARQRAASGLDSPRAVLRVFEGGQVIREQELALESKSYYVHGLEAGRRYRAEMHFVGADGTSHRVGPPSNAVALPAAGVSNDTTLRFLRVSWDTALSRLRESLREGQAVLRQELEPRRYIEWVWKRIQLPGSAGFRDEASPRERLEHPTPEGPTLDLRYVPTPSGMGLSSPSSHTWAGSGTFGNGSSGSGRS